MSLKDEIKKINKDIEAIIEARETIEELDNYEYDDYEEENDIDYEDHYDIAKENRQREEENDNFMRGVI